MQDRWVHAGTNKILWIQFPVFSLVRLHISDPLIPSHEAPVCRTTWFMCLHQHSYSSFKCVRRHHLMCKSSWHHTEQTCNVVPNKIVLFMCVSCQEWIIICLIMRFTVQQMKLRALFDCITSADLYVRSVLYEVRSASTGMMFQGLRLRGGDRLPLHEILDEPVVQRDHIRDKMKE